VNAGGACRFIMIPLLDANFLCVVSREWKPGWTGRESAFGFLGFVDYWTAIQCNAGLSFFVLVCADLRRAGGAHRICHRPAVTACSGS